MWDMLRKQLVTSMLLIARSFKLTKILDSSTFVCLAKYECKQMQKQAVHDKSSDALALHTLADARIFFSTAEHPTSNDKPHNLTATACAACKCCYDRAKIQVRSSHVQLVSHTRLTRHMFYMQAFRIASCYDKAKTQVCRLTTCRWHQ